MTSETLDERLERLSKAFDRMLSEVAKRERPNRLKRVILTEDQVKGWLQQEEGFNKPIMRRISDDSYQPRPSDEDLTEPISVRFI